MGKAKSRGSASSKSEHEGSVSGHAFRLRLRPGRETWTVVYWDPRVKRQVEPSTGEKDPARAKARAIQIVAQSLAGTPPSDGGRPCIAPLSTESLALDWIGSIKGLVDDKTAASYLQAFESHLVAAFPSVLDVTTTSWRSYISKRLQHVQADTVRKELSPMRGLMAWCEETRKIAEQPHLPGIPKRAVGTEFEKRRRAKPDELSPEEIEAIVAALPEWSEKIGPVRSRFELQYAEGLRSHTIDKLSKPEHWREGSDWLELPASALKGREAKRKRLSAAGKAALERACRGLTEGPIFGKRDYRDHIAEAAKVALDPVRAGRFAATHLRSAAITHFLDEGAPLTAAQTFADHKLATTTNRYVRPSQRALEKELRRQGRIE